MNESDFKSGSAPGLYSISVRGMNVTDLLTWASGARIPFIHLRGASRGYDLASQSETTLRRWREWTKRTVPITGVTTDVELSDLLSHDAAVRGRAQTELSRLADAAHRLGAGWLRVLASHPLDATLVDLHGHNLPTTVVPLVAELHHPAALQTACVAAWCALVEQHPGLGLLADTAQLAEAANHAGIDARDHLERTLHTATVLHLSDRGAGLATPRQEHVIELAARRLAAGNRLEVAVEWTGANRTPGACLSRYRAAAAWWSQHCERATESL